MEPGWPQFLPLSRVPLSCFLTACSPLGLDDFSLITLWDFHSKMTQDCSPAGVHPGPFEIIQWTCAPASVLCGCVPKPSTGSLVSPTSDPSGVLEKQCPIALSCATTLGWAAVPESFHFRGNLCCHVYSFRLSFFLQIFTCKQRTLHDH